MNPETLVDYPTLHKLVNEKVITLKGDAYVGIASDGVEVEFGCTGDEQHIDNYLQEHQTPDSW